MGLFSEVAMRVRIRLPVERARTWTANIEFEFDLAMLLGRDQGEVLFVLRIWSS